MKNRLIAMTLVLCLLCSIVFAPQASMVAVHAADVDYVYSDDSYIYNWGTRGETATSLSPNAEAFYTNTPYELLSAYAGGTGTSDAPTSALYSQLQTLMKNAHHYETSYGDTRYLFCYTDCQNSAKDSVAISSFYSGKAIGPDWDSGATWNREHTWPNSKGDASGNGENDLMMLRPASVSENSSRGNKAYGESTGFYNPNEVSNEAYDLRGDVSRIMLYVYVRWGNTGSMWGSDGVMESLDILLKWMEEDPVDTWELGRNDSVESITGTRNVFVDYPELAFLLFGAEIPEDLVSPTSGNLPSSHTHSYTAVVTAPTCTAEGYTTYTCECGYSYNGEYTEIVAHVYVDGVCSFCGEAETGGTVATLVTDVSTLQAGDQIIIVASGYDNALSTNQKSNNRDASAVTKNGNTITYGDDTQIITLESGNVDGTFAFNVGNGYLYAASSSKNYLRTETTLSNNSSWSITIDAAGVATVKAQGTNTRNWLRYNLNNGSPLFACYEKGQENISIYEILPAEDPNPEGGEQYPAGTMVFGADGVATLYLEDGAVKTFTGWLTEVYEVEDDYEISAGGFMTTTPWWEHGWDITSVIIEEGVSPVSTAYWFTDCSNLTNVTIGSGITDIGDLAFRSCGMTEIILPEGVATIGESAFENCSALTTIAIPASLTTIGDYAFDSCDSLTTVIYCGSGYMEPAVNIGRYNDPLFMALGNLQHHQFQDGQCALCGSKYLAQGTCGENLTWTLTPDGLLTISGTGAMEWGLYDHPWQAYSDILRTVVIEEGATTIYTGAFRGTDITSVTIPSGIISIGDYAFDSCYELKSFNIPDGVQSIGVGAFSGCLDATGHLVIPDSVTSLGDAAFSSCMSLTGLTIGSGITVIGRDTFGGCSGITEVTIPDGVTTIGEYAFQVCGFTQVVIPASVTSIAGNAFSNCENLTAFAVDEENTAFSTDAQGILYNKDKTVLVTAPCKISSCVIPDTVITVGDYAFGYCPNLTELTLGNNVVTIGAYAFWLCGMTEIHIPDSVTTIGNQAFAACDNMTVAILGNGVTTVGNYAFGNAPLTLLRLPGSIATIGSEAFRDTLTTVIYCGTAEQWTQIENYTREYIFSNTLQFHDMQNGACIYCSAADEVETEGTCGDNLTWSFVDGVLTISGTGDMWDYEWINDQTNSTPWSKLVITEVRIEQGVTSIGNYAFEGCADLTSVTIAPSVSNIGNDAFSECTGLTAITIPEGVTTISQFAFAYCTGLTQLVIPDSVTSVAEQAFRECTGLTDLAIGTGITKIANYMFAFCDNLTCVSIPDGVTEIEYGAFQGCEALTQVRFPASIKSIGYESFKNCSSLTTVIYCGTPSQWEEVSIMTYNNGFLLNAAMQYHDFQDGVCSYCGASCVDHVWNDATCTAPKTCVICGATEGEALEHNYVDGVCSLCGVEIIYGDANGDGEVDGKDLLLLRRYMANYNFGTGESAIDVESGADANGDGTVDGKDLLLMRRYMANYNFSTGESTIVLGPTG